MNQRLNELEAIYLNLLSQSGLIEIEQAPEKCQESLDAMRSAGWLEEFQNATGKRWSKPKAKLYQNYDSVFRRLQIDVENDIDLLGGKIDGNVFVGGDPIGMPNASATQFHCGYLILLRFELVQLLYQLAKIFCQSLDLVFVDTRDGSEPQSAASLLGFVPSGWTKERTIEAVADVFGSIRQDGTLANAPRQELPQGPRAIFLSELVNYGERFILSHEYSHILQGHCGEARDRKLSSHSPYAGLESQAEEFAADEMASVYSWHRLTGPAIQLAVGRTQTFALLEQRFSLSAGRCSTHAGIFRRASVSMKVRTVLTQLPSNDISNFGKTTHAATAINFGNSQTSLLHGRTGSFCR